MNGFRQPPEPSRKERLRSLETELKNSQMSVRIAQMMVQQLIQSVQNMSQDLGKALGLINEMQYKLLAIQKIANLDVNALNGVANELRLRDFSEASDREDQEKGFTVGTVIDENSTVILTSTTTEPDSGIFRSRIRLADCGIPEMIKAFVGQSVGAKATVKLNGADHVVEVLGIRQPPASTELADNPELPTETVCEQ